MRTRDKEHEFVRWCRLGLKRVTMDLADAAVVAVGKVSTEEAGKWIWTTATIRNAALRTFIKNQLESARLPLEDK